MPAGAPGGGGAALGSAPGRSHSGMITQFCVYVKARNGDRLSARCYNASASRGRVRIQIMRTFLGVVELILAVLVMLGVLLQTPKASGLGGTIGGGGDSGGGYRTKRGLEKNLFYATIGLVVIFVAVSVVYIRV